MSFVLCVVFLLIAVFYLLTAATSRVLALYGHGDEPYNQLANAFLHLHLFVGRAPPALLRLANPYDPAQNEAVISRYHVNGYSIFDFALYHGRLFLTWGPAPAIVLLIPMRLLGFAPSAPLVVALFAIVGMGFALATLRVLLREIGNSSTWMCVLAALTLALASEVAFLLRRPDVYEEAIAGGYCFAMAGVWLVISAIARRRVTLWRAALMSLCFGIAAGSRPTLALAALLLAPVYISLRSTLPRRQLLSALIFPVLICLLLLSAYNQARFGSPLQYGEPYQLGGGDSRTAQFASVSNVAPGAWFYLMSPPRPLVLFPYISLSPPPDTYPLGLPAHYELASTGGLLAMAPIVLFLVALPWIWRRRPALLGPLALPLSTMALTGVACLLFLVYELPGTATRYEVDFASLLLFSALAAWLALAGTTRRWRRRLVRWGGGLLAAWSCLSGFAISFTGSEKVFTAALPGVWSTLENIGAPVSSAIAVAAGRPVLGEVSVPSLARYAPARYTSLNYGPATFQLKAGEQADLTIVSPGVREAALLAHMAPGPALAAGAALWAVVGEVGHASYSYPLPARGGAVRIPVTLGPGVNHLTLGALASAIRRDAPASPSERPLLAVEDLTLGALSPS
jgi:hypothetical protein